MASARVAPEETNLFQIDLARDSYHIAIDSGACIFDYDGSFAFRDGAWSASVPVLASVGKVGR